jgi:gamma-butyrobetaine dioxygenase
MTMTNDHSNIIRHRQRVEVRWPGGDTSTLPYLWLRDNCACGECRLEQTTEKKFMLGTVSVDLQPAEISLQEDQLLLTWPDAHKSCYDGLEIRAFNQEKSMPLTTWGAGFQPRKTDYRTFLTDDFVAAEMLSNFLEYGAAIIATAPVQPNTLEELAPRIGPLREVMFARIHDVVVDATGYNVAHTPIALLPHNDFPSYSWPPSIQALHMLVNETPGGASVIVDGWNILEKYRTEHPDLFESLCTMPVPFRMFDRDNETNAIAPLVRCDTEGNIVALRFSNQLMQPMPPDRSGVALFYRAYHELFQRITTASAQATFRLEAGEILLLASHRVLHGREAFRPTGNRHLQDAYFELDNVKNRLLVLQRSTGVPI